jgi:hypothetical protein
MIEPEWEPVCECKYDPVTDKMDREDCFFHCDMEDRGPSVIEDEPETERKKPPVTAKRRKEDAA